VFSQFADATYTTIAQVIDVIDFAAAIAQLDQDLDDRQNVFVRQGHRAGQLVATDAAVEFHTADSRQIVAIFVVEQAVEQSLDRVFGRRFAWAHHAIYRNLGRHLVVGLVATQ